MTMTSNWPTAEGYVDPAAVIVDGEVVKTGSREACEAYADSQADGREYDYAWRDGARWVHQRSYIDGEAV